MKNFFLYFLIIYCFTLNIPAREIGGLPYDLFIIIIILILWIIAAITSPRAYWSSINTDLFYLTLAWLVVSLLELLNPNANIVGALSEIKTAAVYPFLLVPLGFLIFRSNRQLDIFLILIIVLSTLAALNGIKQLYRGPSPGELRFLKAGGAATHLLWGKLRVFSFYSEAGQFGASQAAIGLSTLVLAMGPFKKRIRLFLFICAGLMLYGMLISGTRGALFALVVGAFTAILLSKRFKVLFIGGFILLSFLFFLRYTHIANGNYHIYRLRSAVNPDDPSLNTRLNTQRMLRDYMASRPFGGGLGVLGYNSRYNQGQYLATVQPDSYFVKIWAMYGIVGLTIWLCIMVYILGKCCGLCWIIQDEGLRVKIIALTAGYAGILFCSYGNEVINNMPSSLVVYFSWVFIFISPQLDKSEKNNLIIC
jgi:O-antigen ligase